MIALALLLAWGPDAEPGAADPVAVETEPEPATTVVLLVAANEEDRERADAIAAHLSGLDVHVETVEVEAIAGALAEKHALAERAALEHAAVATYWVESPREGTLELYLVRPGRREVLVREVSLDPGASEAGIEALAVVARSATSALVTDAALDMRTLPLPEAIEPPPAPAPKSPPTPPPKPPRTRGRARLAVGYAGTSYAREVAWQSGVGFAASWVWPFGLHLGAEYDLMQRVRAGEPGAALEIVRHPIAALLGYGHRFGSVYVEGEAVAILDYAVRHGTSTAPGFAAAPDRGHVTFGLGPRGRFAVVAVWRLELFVQVGAEFWLSAVRYAVDTAGGQSVVVVQPRRVRAHAGAGVAVRI